MGGIRGAGGAWPRPSVPPYVILLIAFGILPTLPSEDVPDDDMPTQPERENDLQTSLRNAAAVGLFVLLAVIVTAGVFAPYFTDRTADTTLILGLSGSILGALLMLLGIQTVLNRREK